MTGIHILGSGFSKSYNPDYAPTVMELLENAKKRKILFPDAYHKDLCDFIYEYFGKKELEINFETLASVLLFDFIPEINEKHDTGKLYKQLIDIINITLGHPDVVNNTTENNKIILKKYSKYLLTNSIDVIGFNYDLILDNFLIKNDIDMEGWSTKDGYGYRIPFLSPMTDHLLNPDLRTPEEYTNQQFSKIKYYKLHGSLNWGKPIITYPDSDDDMIYQDYPTYDKIIHSIKNTAYGGIDGNSIYYEPYIVPPIYNKNFKNKLIKYLWYNAKVCLSQSNEIVILGYSFPSSDITVEFLFRQALAHSIFNKKITIVDRNANNELFKKRIKEIFFNWDDSNDKFVSKDIMDYLKETLPE